MPIAPFTIDGVLPPYVGPDGPGGAVEDMSPYSATILEVVTTLGSSDGRKSILRGWLRHRQALRAIGFNRGFQWLDGSFVESKIPQDLDVFTFLYRPLGYHDTSLLTQLVMTNLTLFDRNQVKAAFKVDFFAVDLDGAAETLVNMSRYYFGLFSHRRGDDLWKGILQVRLENIADDAAAAAVLGPDPTSSSVAGVNP
jgi:Family of unknown function (DUF6932)